MKVKSKVLGWILCLAIVITLLPVNSLPVHAEDSDKIVGVIYIEMDDPLIGMKPSTDVKVYSDITATAVQCVKECFWYRKKAGASATTWEQMTNNMVFEAGYDYAIDILGNFSNGYKADSDTDAFINGKKQIYSTVLDDEWDFAIGYTWTADEVLTPTAVKKIDIKVKEPKVGEGFSYDTEEIITVPEDVLYDYSLWWFHVYNGVSGSDVEYQEVAKEGCEYSVIVCVDLWSDCYIDENTVVTVNGKPVEIRSTDAPNSYYVEVFFNEKIAKNGWVTEDGKVKYYVNDVAKTGWQKIDSKWYYFNASGVMQKGWQKIDSKWYYFNASGVMQTGWQKIDSKWYYFNASGVMQTGWQKISSKWYYFNASGVMQTGWQKISSKWYYFNASGVMQTGWQKISSKWYYFNASGVMQTGWQKIDSKWYYFNASGVMQTGWQKISDKWYYFDANGVMVSNTTITINGISYTFNVNGVWVK